MKAKKQNRGKPFQKGADPRRKPRQPGQGNVSSREVLAALTRAAATAGDRLAAIYNAKLPDKPTAKISAKLLEVLRLDPNGVESYFAWLAEEHPAIFCSLLGRALPQIIQHEDQGGIEVVYHSAEEIAAEFKKRGLPPLKDVFELPKRIDLHDPPSIDVTPDNECSTADPDPDPNQA